MEYKSSTVILCEKAKEASRELGKISDERINKALLLMADNLIKGTDKILEENEKDIDAAKETISSVMLDRLRLTPERILGMADGIREIAKLPSPLGITLDKVERPNGLIIEKKSVAMGVIAIIYESRPNVTSDAAALALKSGSACVLRGGKEAYRSAKAIVDALKKGLSEAGITENAINLVSDTTRQSANELMRASGLVDLLIPRGGAGLIRACVENATVPCLETGTGICHIYVDKSADLDKAVSILENAKTSRPSVCNACEVCLVHKDIAKEFLPMVKERLVANRLAEKKEPVELRLDTEAIKIIEGTPAKDTDFDTEFLDYILGVKIVSSIDEAVEHITHHSTHHSEAIIAEDRNAQESFVTGIDSAAVYINASTRFTDGGEFGLGCEMGISTQKLHARGPLGIRELTTYKYIIHGDGQVR
ncbi:MAG: glutamate-5-semialdehyde dehydrogenase [Clostridia bacterium]|nr:glutamate-5-semialdehyde dehydrogenase [Clostridia bacterium]